jgi:hypothetical protein
MPKRPEIMVQGSGNVGAKVEEIYAALLMLQGKGEFVARMVHCG